MLVTVPCALVLHSGRKNDIGVGQGLTAVTRSRRRLSRPPGRFRTLNVGTLPKQTSAQQEDGLLLAGAQGFELLARAATLARGVISASGSKVWGQTHVEGAVYVRSAKAGKNVAAGKASASVRIAVSITSPTLGQVRAPDDKDHAVAALTDQCGARPQVPCR